MKKIKLVENIKYEYGNMIPHPKGDHGLVRWGGSPQQQGRESTSSEDDFRSS